MKEMNTYEQQRWATDQISQPPKVKWPKLGFDQGNTLVVVFLESLIPVVSTVSGSVVALFQTSTFSFLTQYLEEEYFFHILLHDVSIKEFNQSFCFITIIIILIIT